MARKKVAEDPVLKSWDEVDDTMKQLLEAQSCIDQIEINMNREIAEAKEKAAKLAEPAQSRIKKLEVYIKDFVTDHRSELNGKSRKLNFGSTGFHLTKHLIVPKGTENAVLAKLHQLGLLDCIRGKETVNKEVLKQKAPEIISETGAYVNTKDDFWYELDQDKLQRSEQ